LDLGQFDAACGTKVAKVHPSIASARWTLGSLTQPSGHKVTKVHPSIGGPLDLGQFDAARGTKVTKVGVLRGADGG
jgi:hypothetical protein